MSHFLLKNPYDKTVSYKSCRYNKTLFLQIFLCCKFLHFSFYYYATAQQCMTQLLKFFVVTKSIN
jgi:hypothetical protein